MGGTIDDGVDDAATSPQPWTGEPPWLRYAREDIGRRETTGPNDAPWLRKMLARVRASWLIGQPWCGSIMADWMRAAGLPYPTTFYRALSWATWGRQCLPVVGAVAVFKRPGGGHVGILVGRDPGGRLLVLGGNSGDAVAIIPISAERLVAVRWPTELVALAEHAPELPTLLTSAATSTNEA